MNAKIRAKLKRNRILAVLLLIAFVFCCVVMVLQIVKLQNDTKTLEARDSRLDEQIKDQEDLQAALDDEEAYVNTPEYIEEKAKSIGYVYPDEIIFKRAD